MQNSCSILVLPVVYVIQSTSTLFATVESICISIEIAKCVLNGIYVNLLLQHDNINESDNLDPLNVEWLN